ncbi:MAG: transglycosylase domain-containing protein, partial [Clostridiales Family XIII bacterium]|nr:transglycosylase domain-containing protein [Clostridiales Family XIII bacterium]
MNDREDDKDDYKDISRNRNKRYRAVDKIIDGESHYTSSDTIMFSTPRRDSKSKAKAAPPEGFYSTRKSAPVGNKSTPVGNKSARSGASGQSGDRLQRAGATNSNPPRRTDRTTRTQSTEPISKSQTPTRSSENRSSRYQTPTRPSENRSSRYQTPTRSSEDRSSRYQTPARSQAASSSSKSYGASSRAQSRNSSRFPKEDDEVVAKRSNMNGSGKKRRKPRKRHHAIKTVLATLFIIMLVSLAGGVLYIYSVLKDVPEVDPKDIESRLSVTSTMYDDAGTPIRSIYTGDGQRTLVSYEQIPQNLRDAIVAVEDKTFWEHHGFNFVRILGAIRDSITTGGDISGTSTITQQLARNIWLFDERSDRTLERKLQEAYYSVQIEEALGKEEILRDYLNTIPLGNHSNGIQAAAKSYFGKNVEELDLIECAALASLPAAPSVYAMIETIPKGQIAAEDPRLLLAGVQYDYIYNDTIEKRVRLVLDLMLDQGYITKEEHAEAKAQNLRDHIHPSEFVSDQNTSAFVDWAIGDIAEDLFKKYPERFDSVDDAERLIYTGGLNIYTTVNRSYQEIIAREFADTWNFPGIASMRTDGAGNMITDAGVISLFAYSNIISPDGYLHFSPDEAAMREDGSLILYAGHRLNLYPTMVGEENDVSIELKNMYRWDESGELVMNNGGVVNIPLGYKTLDDAGNCIISAKVFEDYPELIVRTEDGGIHIPLASVTISQWSIQPQAAMVIMDNHNGQVKAMMGGRNVQGEMSYNRAVVPHQPGSCMKPMGVYSAALQMSAENVPIEAGEANFGKFWTPMSVVEDKRMEYGGRVWPENWYLSYRGAMTMRTAIEQSVNVVAVKVQLNIGNDRSVAMLKKLGISTLVEEGEANDLNPASLALGGMTQGVTPLDMTTAYASFVNSGVRTDPISYTQVTDRNGEVLLDGTSAQEQVMDPGVAFMVNDMLRTAVTSGVCVNAYIPGIPTAGKTGTTENNFNIWFSGNTPRYAAAIWIGNDFSAQLAGDSPMAAALWSRILSQCLNGSDPGEFAGAPENVERISVSGYTDYVIKGTGPSKITVAPGGKTKKVVCKESGYLATPWCPSTEEKEFESTDAPKFYCHMHNTNPGQYPIDPSKSLDKTFDPNPKPEQVIIPSFSDEASARSALGAAGFPVV